MQALHKVLNMPEYGWITLYGRVLNMSGQHRVLNKLPVLNMPGLRVLSLNNASVSVKCLNNAWICVCLNNAWIWLNMSAYIWKKKQSAEYTRILNMSDAVHNIRSLYKLLITYREWCIPNTVKHLRWSDWQRCRKAGEEWVVELGHLNKHCVKNTRQRGPAGKHFEVASARCS